MGRYSCVQGSGCRGFGVQGEGILRMFFFFFLEGWGGQGGGRVGSCVVDGL